jgi:hypothetical protein
LKIYDELSKQFDKYNKTSLSKFWSSIKPKSTNKLSIKTLYMWYYELFPEKKPKKSSKKASKQEGEYEEAKINFELNNFKILNPIMFATLDKDDSMILRKKDDFKTVYENLLIGDDQFTSLWLKDSNNRTYDKLDFLPMLEAPKHIFNTFRGYEADKLKTNTNDFTNSLIMKHIKNLCNNDESVFNYFIKWLARKVQAPTELTRTALIIKSLEGAGKDLFFDYFGTKILGSKYYFNESDTNKMFGKFNSDIENKILVVINEASGSDTYTINEAIKNAITRKKNNIEHKGMKPYEITNTIGYVFLTNNDNPVKVSPTDRRFMGFECNSEICNNAEYFKPLVDEMEGGKYDRPFYDYLMSFDVKDYDFHKERPNTTFYNNMKEMNIPIIARFFENYIDNTTSPIETLKSSSLFAKFNDFMKSNNIKIEYTSTKFGVELNNYLGIVKEKKRDASYYVINIEELKKFLISKYKIEFSEVEFIESEKTSDLDM